MTRRSRVLRRCVVAGVAMVAALGTSEAATAQQASPQALGTRTDSTAAPSGSGWHLEQCMGGLTYGAPLKLAVAYGGGLLYESNGGPDYCALVVAKVGFGGAQGSTGIGTSFAPWGTGVMVTGNVVRTFSAPLEATPRRTYVGASVHFWPAFALGGELGYLWRLGDEDGESTAGKRILTWSVGFGF